MTTRALPVVAESLLRLERPEPYIALVTLNRPHVHNCVNAAMANAMREVVREIEADDEIRVAVLSAAGDAAFCTGADLREVAAGRSTEIGPLEEGFAAFAYVERRKPWIAAVQGMAYGGGFELALACEMIVAGVQARFALTEVRWGLIAGSGGAFRLPRLLPKAIAMELLCAAAPLTAQQAFTHGLVNRVVPGDQVVSESLTLARAVARNAPLAVTASLQIARRALQMDEPTLRHELYAAAVRLSQSADAREGARAFAEKRQPQWTGYGAEAMRRDC